MQNKSILITGCSSGIGYYLAHAFHQQGYRVFATARKTEDVEYLTQQGLCCMQLDVSNAKNIHEVVKQILNENNGNVFALINNAGYGQPGAVEDLSHEALQKQFDTNFFGLVEIINAFLPVMIEQGYGRIINISSVLGLVAMPMRGAYIASKFALEGITDTLRLELKGTNVYVSLIEPGPIISHFRQNSLLMLKKYIDTNNSRFKNEYASTVNKLKQEGAVAPFTLGPEAVLHKTIRALESQHPKPRYFVTFPTYLFAILKRILPTTALDNLLIRSTKIERK